MDIRICDLCGKTFVGGKALGGHRRSHFQAKKVAGLTIKIKKEHVLGDKTKMAGCCCICNKDFPSMRSLFGHMRAHPDRDWKGIQPPLHRKCYSSADDDDDNNGEQLTRAKSDSQFSKSVSNWSKTERRRRICTGAVAAAQILVSMARGDCSIDDDDDYDDDDDDDDQAVMDGGKSFMDQRFDPSVVEQQIQPGKSKKKRLKKKMRDSSESEELVVGLIDKNDENCYKCSTCDRTFTTFQGLGGHRSIHNKDNKNRELATNLIAAFAEESTDGSKESNIKTFPSPGEGSQTGPRRMEFDLNEPYDDHMEGEGIDLYNIFNQV